MAKIFVSFNIVSTSTFFLIAREKDNPLAIVYQSAVLTPPHTQRNVTIEPVNPVMHSVELWDTLDGLTLNQLRGQCDIDASLNTSLAFDTIQFVVAGPDTGAPQYDPSANQTQYVNPDLDGKTYLVFKPGSGALKEGLHYQQIVGGGFEFIDGQEFSADDVYTVMVSNLVTNQTAPTNSGKSYPDDVVEETDNFNISSAHYNKLIEINDTANVVTIATIIDIDTIPNGTVFGFNTHNGTQKGVKLQLPSGKYCLINGVQENVVYIGRAEEVTFIKKGNYLRIVNWDGDYKRVGERVMFDGTAPANTLPESGGWYLQSDYPRLFNWYIQRLNISELGTGTDDIAPSGGNIYKWIIGATKFWVPDTRNLFIRGASAGRVAGIYEADDNKAHNHVSAPYNRSIARASDVDGTNTVTAVDSSSATNEYRVAGMDNTKWTAATIVDQGASEARPKNVTSNFYRIV